MGELSSKDAVLLAAKRAAMARGYAGLNFRDQTHMAKAQAVSS